MSRAFSTYNKLTRVDPMALVDVMPKGGPHAHDGAHAHGGTHIHGGPHVHGGAHTRGRRHTLLYSLSLSVLQTCTIVFAVGFKSFYH